jgi:hypothetical protein
MPILPHYDYNAHDRIPAATYMPGDNWPRIPVGCHVQVDEVLRCYASEKNQAIHRVISCQTMCQMRLELRHLAMHLLQ